LKPKPTFLGPEYGAQFQDESVAGSYHARPAYDFRAFPLLAGLRAHPKGPVLELGCGTGDLTLGLAELVDHIDAVEPSGPMLTLARQRCPPALAAKVRWHHCLAEDFRFDGPYALIVAAESLHWMEWPVVMPKIWASLAEGAFLAVVDRRGRFPDGLGPELGALIPRYSTNQEYQPYDLIVELESRGLFREVGRKTFDRPVALGVDDIIEWHHSENGFSRQRMTAEASREFDDQVRGMVATHHAEGRVPIRVETTVVWGMVR
jgi:SAM-dependent methyltransferase